MMESTESRRETLLAHKALLIFTLLPRLLLLLLFKEEVEVEEGTADVTSTTHAWTLPLKGIGTARRERDREAVSYCRFCLFRFLSIPPLFPPFPVSFPRCSCNRTRPLCSAFSSLTDLKSTAGFSVETSLIQVTNRHWMGARDFSNGRGLDSSYSGFIIFLSWLVVVCVNYLAGIRGWWWGSHAARSIEKCRSSLMAHHRTTMKPEFLGKCSKNPQETIQMPTANRKKNVSH